jgi:outer membrane immunogenic protein
MKKHFGWAFASALVFGSLGSAFAADMPMKALPMVAPAPVCLWCGFYVGGDVGGFWDRQSATTNAFPAPGFGAPAIGGAGIAGFGNLPTTHTLNRSGFAGGIYGGYNWQINQFVVGVEGDISGLDRQTATSTQTVFASFPAVPTAAYTMTVSANNNWVATARARAGFAAGPGLWYVTGGAAWTEAHYAAAAAGLIAPGINTTGQTAAVAWSDTRTGWVVGTGVEWMFQSHWTLRAEYLYHEFSGSSAVAPLVGLAAGGGNTCVGQCGWNINTSTQRLSIARVGVGYKF